MENTDDVLEAGGPASGRIEENTDAALEDGGSGGIVGEEGEVKETNGDEDIADDATNDEILAGIPLPSDPRFKKQPGARYIPRGVKHTDIVYELERNRGYTRQQTIWLMGADRPGEKAENSNAICMRLSRYAKQLALKLAKEGKALPPKVSARNRRTALDTSGGAKAYTPGLLEELATRYGEESLVPGSGDWEMDLVPQWARRIWRLFARACKLKNLKTPDVSNFP